MFPYWSEETQERRNEKMSKKQKRERKAARDSRTEQYIKTLSDEVKSSARRWDGVELSPRKRQAILNAIDVADAADLSDEQLKALDTLAKRDMRSMGIDDYATTIRTRFLLSD